MHIKRWTQEEMERAREQGNVLGMPRKFTGGQVEEMRRMREEGASLRRIAADSECSPSTGHRRPNPRFHCQLDPWYTKGPVDEIVLAVSLEHRRTRLI